MKIRESVVKHTSGDVRIGRGGVCVCLGCNTKRMERRRAYYRKPTPSKKGDAGRKA